MKPLYMPGFYVLVQPIQCLAKSINRGDIVLLSSVSLDGKVIIKRVIGLPNELIQIDNGELLINHEPFEEPYLSKTSPDRTSYTGEWMLKSDEYFVLGDNRMSSLDSRRLGPIRKDWIQGKVFIRIWPLRNHPRC